MFDGVPEHALLSILYIDESEFDRARSRADSM